MDTLPARRRRLRLRDYDYHQSGAYFVTLCTYNRACLLGDVVGDLVQLSPAGELVAQVWLDLPKHYANLSLDAMIIMPNHLHGIVCLDMVGAGFKPTLRTNHGLPEIIRALKTFSARRINLLRQTPGAPVWQRNYYEHIVRDETELLRVREYIANNPLQWALDAENPANRP